VLNALVDEFTPMSDAMESHSPFSNNIIFNTSTNKMR